VLLVSVPYAIKAGDAETLGGLPASAYLLASGADSAAQTAWGSAAAATATDVLPTAAVTSINRIVKDVDGAGTLGDSSLFDDGNVGIGTTAPSAPLHVAKDSNFLSDTGAGLIVGNATTANQWLTFGYDGAADAGYLQAAHVGVDVKPLLLNPAGGSVGLGTAVPQATMHVAQNSSYLSGLAAGLLVSHRSLPAKRMMFGYDGNIDAGYIQSVEDLVDLKPLVLNPAGGNVGIGTTTPTAALDVVGDLKVSGNIFGAINSIGTLGLPHTTNSTTGVITFGGNRFLHNFGWENTFVGENAGNFTVSGSFNSAIGAAALYSNSTGTANTASGHSALKFNTSGSANTATGFQAMFNNSIGSGNTASGDRALFANQTGGYNTAMGGSALLSNTNGVSNTALGYGAGLTIDVANANTEGSNNTFLGTNSGPGTLAQLVNATAIGANAVVSQDNSLVLGSIAGVNGATSSVMVGIGTSAPTARLEVSGGDVKVSGGGKFIGDGSALTNLSGFVNGSGTTNMLPKFTGSTTLGNSQITDDGTDVTVSLTGGGFKVLANATSPIIIGGFSGNTVTSGVVGGTISGGGQNSSTNRVTDDFGTVGGGSSNQAGNGVGPTENAPYATVGGGYGNTAAIEGSTVAGGGANTAAGSYAAVGGGYSNHASAGSGTIGGGNFNSTGPGPNATVSGGHHNVATGLGYATVGGGFENTASGVAATVAGGSTNTAIGNSSTVGGGLGNEAAASKSTIGGGGRTDDGNAATGNRVTDDYGTVGGGGNNQAGDNAGSISDRPFATVGGGQENTASGSHSTVGGGINNDASAIYATVAGGKDNTASGSSATVPGGANNTAQGEYSFAAGRRAKVNHPGSFVWGDSTDADFASTANNQFLIRANGGVGIGTNQPFNTLQVFGDIRVGTSGTNGCLVHFGGGAIAGSCASDARLKKNIRPFGSSLEKVRRLQPVTFQWRAEEYPERGFNNETDFGLIAQEVEKVLPELVTEDEQGYKAVKYNLLPLLNTQAIGELKGEKDAEIEQLRGEVEELRAIVEALQRRLGVEVSQQQ
jgi:hypothetical protein